MAIIRELLRKWAALEPEKCKLETRPNQDWHEEFEDFYIASEAGNEGEPGYGWGWQLVLTDNRPGGYHPWKSESLMRIQWAVQEAIANRKWGFTLAYDSDYEAGISSDADWDTWSQGKHSAIAALLEAYIAALEMKESTRD